MGRSIPLAYILLLVFYKVSALYGTGLECTNLPFTSVQFGAPSDGVEYEPYLGKYQAGNQR